MLHGSLVLEYILGIGLVETFFAFNNLRGSPLFMYILVEPGFFRYFLGMCCQTGDQNIGFWLKNSPSNLPTLADIYDI